MAKRKTPKVKKEKIVDLNLKPEKVEEQELANLQAIIKTIDQLTVDVGRMEIQKNGLMDAMKNMQVRIDASRRDIIKKYGTDDVNIQTGVINYPPENHNTPENGEVNKED
tara:strand:- start:170 stop:499 length:330 start_codon:yes stop_codon:yes gene_type:complete